MSEKSQHNNILLALGAFTLVVVTVGLIGFVAFKHTPEIIQGEVDCDEYRVSTKLPSRVLEIRVKEGDYVHAGDTLAILEAPEINAEEQQAKGMEIAAQAVREMTDNGARQEQIKSAYQVWQQASAASEIAKKSYTRMQHLFDEGVTTAQKRDEAFASYKASEAAEKATKSQYDLALSGARNEEKKAAAAHESSAKAAVNVIKSFINETVQIAQMDGEVTDIYPKVGELVGSGSPIMSISILNNLWGTFNVRADQIKGMKIGDTFTAFVPAFNKNMKLKVYYMKDEGSYAVWKATKSNGQYDLKTFEVKARPVTTIEGLRPGMSLIIKDR